MRLLFDLLREVFPSPSEVIPLALDGGLVLHIADVLFFCRIEGQIADRCYEVIDAESDDAEEEISRRSRSVTFGLILGVVDDEASDPAEEEGEQKANKILIFIHK